MRRAFVPLLLFAMTAGGASAATPTPEEFLGHPVGADRQLAPYSRVLEYLGKVAETSDRVSLDPLGSSTLGNEMLAVVLTSAANQAELARYREIAQRLANPDRLAPGEAEALAAEGKLIALVTCTIHSTEVGCTQMATEFAYDFATTDDPDKLRWMDDVILLLIPSINPDGQVMVVDWYQRYLGTEYEGGPMPWLYHHYVGHDNNRDFYMLTQEETRVVNDALYHRWFPQVFVDEHQMGSTGPRMFVPPQTDPLALEVDPLIFRQADLIGTNMSYRLEEAGKTGVGHDMIFDSYWPGGTRNTAWWKNVTGLLTEVASARIATPIYVDPGELRGGMKGLPEYKRRANFPSPWPGGWWRLRDIVEYELVATWALVETGSHYRAELLTNFAAMGRAAVAAGAAGSPGAWIVSPEQHDPGAADQLVELLLRHGIRVLETEEEIAVGRTRYPAGTRVVPAAQPYRSFLLTMLRPQRYPETRPYVDGPILPPYDVTAWSLPILMGVEITEVAAPIAGPLRPLERVRRSGGEVAAGAGGYRFSHRHSEAFRAMNRLLAAGQAVYWLPEADEPGAVWLPPGGAGPPEALSRLSRELGLPIEPLAATPEGARLRVRAPRVGLYKPWRASMDEGWTRYLLEGHGFDYRNLDNAAIQEGSFRSEIDVLVFPDVSKSILEQGEPETPEARRFASRLPPEYSGGIGTEGLQRIREWVERGGAVVALDASTALAIDLFALPVVNVLEGGGREGFSAPGTMLRMLVDTSHPLAYGMRTEEAGYFANSAAFRTSVPDGRIDRQVVVRFPDHRDDIPVSGYIEGAEKLERRAAVVEYRVGDGRVILIGFRAQHRAQPVRTFKLLFNALYYGLLAPES